MVTVYSPTDATIGPMARASDPRLRNIPKTVPFWDDDPYLDAIVVIHGTTNEVANNNRII